MYIVDASRREKRDVVRIIAQGLFFQSFFINISRKRFLLFFLASVG